jgi:outer membrane protein assembly factor BamB
VAGPLTFVADTGNKTLNCVETATGKELWTHPVKGAIWSSPFVADGKLYFGTRSGSFYIFAATRVKKLLCETTLDNSISAPPAAANGVLYVVTDDTLYALAKP